MGAQGKLNSELKIGFIGCGNMGKAIMESLLKSKACESSQLMASYPSAGTHKKLSTLLPDEGQEIVDNNELVEKCDLIFMCFKPQMIDSVFGTLKIVDKEKCMKKCFLSVLAGTTLSQIEDRFHAKGIYGVRIARFTLNTAARVGASCSVFCQNKKLSLSDCDNLRIVLSSVGECLGEVQEKEIDAAMAMSGSSIAYMYTMCEAMSDAGVKLGLRRDLSTRLAVETMWGAGTLMRHEQGDKHLMQMKDEVCSAGGATIHGMHELERTGFRNSVICAIEGATKRCKELGQ